MGFRPTEHPVILIPTLDDVRRYAAIQGIPAEEAFVTLHKRREEIIRREANDPLRYGWEPPSWKVFDAILGLERYGIGDPVFAERMRSHLGFREPVRVLLLLGGNRGGKSEYCAKRCVQVLVGGNERVVWPFHSTATMSIEYQHKLFWKYLPPEDRRFVRGEVEYIAYKQKTGFSDGKFVLSNGSETSFRNYSQDKDDAIEGGDIDVFWADELVPPDWVETLILRLATRAGFGLVSFTPVAGYSPTVRMFQDGAKTVKDSVCFLLPKDGGEPDEVRALGFQGREEMMAAHTDGRWSIPQDCSLWLDGQSGQPEEPAGRKFERLPRIMRCFTGSETSSAIGFVHSSDNPFGRPSVVLEMIRGKSVEFVRERFYGWATKTISNRFPKFNRAVHVIPESAIPTSGMRVMVLDPASGRNFFMKWYVLNSEGVFLYREWPGRYLIPGVGVPGPWALPDGKRLDGRPGEGQRPFGWGLLRYKEEIARLEGWKPLTSDKLAPAKRRQSMIDWSAEGAREKIAVRIIDSRAASSPRIENDRPRTLLTDFEDMNLFFDLAPGEEIDEGIVMINSAFDYDVESPIDYFNKPHYFVADTCENSIFALETWTGDQGNKGASKDPIDCDRYLFMSDIEYIPDECLRVRGGGYF